MQRDYWYTAARAPEDLDAAEAVGRTAGARTLRRLGARQLATLDCPVLFEAPEAADLVGYFVQAVSGGSLYRKSSFLLDSLGTQVFAPHVQLREEPHLPRGRGSAPFDNEGVATRRARRRARRRRAGLFPGLLLGAQARPASHRQRRRQSQPGARRTARTTWPRCCARMGRGLLVTEQLGQGVNPVTGDFSRGAAGFWVENGEIAYPVEEITIAGNLQAMFRDIVAIGNDVDRRGSRHVGSIMVETMTVAGQ